MAEPPPPVPHPVHGIRAPQPVNLETNVAENWRLFKQKWQNYAVITHLNGQQMPYQVALLLHTLGDEALKIYNGFNFPTPEVDRTVEDVLEKFDAFAVGEINEIYERFVFNKREQKESESFESFHAAIRTLVKTCNYCANCVDSILRDRIVLGIKDATTQTTLLKERQLTLETCIDICKAAENATTQDRMLRPDTVNKIASRKPYKKRVRGPERKTTTGFNTNERECKFCGKIHVMKKEECPACGKSCTKCKQLNHFANRCPKKFSTYKSSRDKGDHQVTEYSSSDEEWKNSIHTPGTKDIKCHLRVGESDVVFQIDTGSSVNILPARYAGTITPTDRKLKMWNHTELSPLGSCRTTVRNLKTNKKYSVEFVVVKEDLTPLIVLRAAEQMKLITVNDENVDRVAAVSLVDTHPDVFRGSLGSFPGKHRLKVDENGTPVVMATRRVPIAVRPKLKAELDRLTKLQVIAPIDEPTPWVSQLVIVEKKSGDLRICLYPRELNKALQREHYTLPILEDTLHELSKSRVFSKADPSSGYWHVQRDDESRKLTTSQAPYGRYMWCRLPFGTNVSSEIFQKKLLEQREGLPGIVCLADDVIIHGEDMETHDRNLELFLVRCEESSIVLNLDKLELRMSEITFMGHRITSEGLQSDPEKVKAISEMSAPQNLEELRRYLGMINYLAKFLDHVTVLLTPLQNLTKKDVPWVWSETQQEAFERVRDSITKAPVLAFYDPNKELTLENDACEYGLGPVLFQDGRPAAYASRSLTDAETRYAQIEKELLAVSFGLEKFHHYTYGRLVNVFTDHKPLVSIVTKPLSKAPKRLQSLLLRTQYYDYHLIYKPGKAIPAADALSRAPLEEKPSAEKVTVNNLSFSPIKTARLDEIRAATQQDVALQLLKVSIMDGWPENKHSLSPLVAPYFSYRDELTVQDGIIVRGQRVVIPSAMRTEIKQKLHTGHMGINSCLRRARELVFWPGMSHEIRHFVEPCDICATYGDKQAPESLYLHAVPSRPWEKVGTDLFTIEDRAHLVTTDYYSNFFEVDFLPELTSGTVVTKLKHHFARHGIPDTLISDGGPQYSSAVFKLCSDKWGFTHDMSRPGNSKANGAAEAAVKIAKRLMKRSIVAKEDPYRSSQSSQHPNRRTDD